MEKQSKQPPIKSLNQYIAETKANKTDGGNGSYGIRRVIDASRSPSPDPSRSAQKRIPSPTMLDKTNREHQILALHRYYIWTTVMKQDFEAAFVKGDHFPKGDESPYIWPMKYMASDVGTYMSYWYGGLFVVCEGWQELGLADPTIDALLAHSNLGLLKRYRNGAFHFQKDYFDARFEDFKAEQGTVEWVRNLSSALGSWFLAHIQANTSQP